MFGIGHLPELIIVAVIIILFFGAKNIPGLARGLGQGMNEFKKATKEEEPEKTATKE